MFVTLRKCYWSGPDGGVTNLAENGTIDIEFDSSVGSGKAAFVSSRLSVQPRSFFEQQSFGVETAWDAVGDVRILPPGESQEPRLISLSAPGDFQAVGEVQLVDFDRETSELYLVHVLVGDGWFPLSSKEVGQPLPVVGDWVSFTVIGLELYDEGY